VKNFEFAQFLGKFLEKPTANHKRRAQKNVLIKNINDDFLKYFFEGDPFKRLGDNLLCNKL